MNFFPPPSFPLRAAILLLAVLPFLRAAGDPWVFFPGNPSAPGAGKRVVFLTGDEEYRSEESMPMLARILAARHGFDCTVLFSINPGTGVIEPERRDNLPGLEALERADLMVVFTRFRVLPDAQMRHIDAYLASGRPVIGVRTATHAFGSFSAATHPAGASTTFARWEWNHSAPGSEGGFGRQVLGATHRNHWGLHGKQSTRGRFAPGAAGHPLLTGIRDGEIWGPTDVYEVLLPLPDGCTPVLLGEVLQGMSPESPPVTGEQLNPKWRRMIRPNEPMLPVVWTHTRPTGARGRVVTFTNGGAMAGTADFASAGLRRLFVNAVYWTTGLEGKIPAQADVTPLEPRPAFQRGVTPAAALRLTTPALEPRAGDTFVFYGGGMVERLLESGHLEAQLQLAHPGKKLRVRSLAWTGDEVGHRLRPEGYVEHLKGLLAAWPANVVVLGFGANESFAGPAGLPDFRRHYETFLREVDRLHPGARVVLLAPAAPDERSDPRAAARRADVAAYAAAVREIAAARGADFVDLFTASAEAFTKAPRPLTELGIHLNAEGSRALGTVIARALAGSGGLASAEPPRVEEVAAAAARKHAYNAELTRPKNAALYYGVRKRPEEAAVELPRYHQLLAQAEDTVHGIASRPGARLADFPEPSLPPLGPGKETPYRFPGGTVRAPADLQKELVVADGYAVNLFASETQFPELRNPVQMSFDARGRLWVVTMPSFPHAIPGERPADKILILEDTDRDGRADTCTVFADGFDALDGVAFHERGVIVSAQPRLLVLNDTDGDGRADTRAELLRGVDVTDSHHGGMVATDPMGSVIFADGVFHRSQFETPFGVVRGIDSTTYRLDPRSGRVAPEWRTMTPNPWKVSFDGYGNLLQRFGGGHLIDGLGLTWTPGGVYHPYGTATVLNYAKGSGLSVISSPNFPAELQQGYATAALLGSYTVSLSAPSASAGSLVAASRLDVLSSKNSTFRPVDVEFGLDGALYVSDFSSLIIGHAQHAMRDPQWNHERGRIWRVTHTGKPVSRDWPRIEGASAAALVSLLAHPQSLVRHHVRIALRRLGPAAFAELERRVATLAPGSVEGDQTRLEASWVLAAAGEARPAWLDALARSNDPLTRAASVMLLRFTADRLPDLATRLQSAAGDAHPRVRMAAINVVAHLRPQRPGLEAALTHLHAVEIAEKQMLADLAAGTESRVGRSVPVLAVAPETRLRHWIDLGETGEGELNPYATPEQKRKAKNRPTTTRTFRTFLQVDTPQTAVIAVKHGFLELKANGVPVLSSDSPYSSEHQVEIPLRRGLNQIEAAFRRLRGEPPPVYLHDPTGQPVPGARLAANAAALKPWAEEWDRAESGDRGALRVQAVPGLMQFSPTELRVKAGAPVRLIFENPDLMPHNLILVAPGADEEVGALADAMASEPGAMAKHYVPASPKVLHATPLVEPTRRTELNFTAPSAPGRYPYLCTFPGHWRIMRGVLIVE